MQWPWWSGHDPVTVSIIRHPSKGLHYLSDAMVFPLFIVYETGVTKMVHEIFVHQKHKACLGRMWRNGLWGWLGNVGAVRRNVGAWQINRVWPPQVGHPGLTWGMPQGTTAGVLLRIGRTSGIGRGLAGLTGLTKASELTLYVFVIPLPYFLVQAVFEMV